MISQETVAVLVDTQHQCLPEHQPTLVDFHVKYQDGSIDSLL